MMSVNNSVGAQGGDNGDFSAFYHTYKFSNNDSSVETYSPTSLFNLSKSNEMFLKFIVQGVGISLVAILGVFGNIFSILVLSKEKMRAPISCFLIGLAVADTVFTLIGAMVLGVPNCLGYLDSLGDIEESTLSSSTLVMLTPVFFGLALTSQTASIYFTLAVATERFIAVYFPFKARTSLTIKRATSIALGVMLFSILYNFPRWFEYKVTAVYSDHSTRELIGYKPMPSSLKTNEIYDTVYCWFSYLLFMNCLPIAYLAILNILIYKKIRAANKERQSLSSSSQQQEKSYDLSVMLLVIVVIFLVCNILPCVEAILMKVLHKKQTFVEIECIRNFLVIFNSSINFVIYTFLGEKFREIFLQMWPPWIQCFCCCCCCVPSKSTKILGYWNPSSISNGSSTGKFRLSLASYSTKALKDVQVDSVFVSRIN